MAGVAPPLRGRLQSQRRTHPQQPQYQHTGTRVDGSTGLLSLAKTSETIIYSLASPQQFQRELHCSYDSLLRKTGYALSDATTTEQATSYTFDPFSRLRGISSNNAQNLAGQNEVERE